MNTTGTAGRPRVSTEGWTLDSLVTLSENFHPIERVRATGTQEDIQRAITRYEEEGIPMIIEGWHEHDKWPKDMFTLDFFRTHSVGDTIRVRNVHDLKDSTIPLDEFITHCRTVPPCAPENESTRMYGKDAECPEDWKSHLEASGMLPSSLLWSGPNDYFRYRPKSAPVETLMCYLGIGDTFTAAHKDLCASSGHNLMCYTENDGASYWFMTKGSAAPDVEDFFRELGQELDHETHVVSLKQLKSAPFDVYIGRQALGDLVLVPPRSCHQVVNAGGITLKASWSRMSLKGLSVALHHELPLYQRVCRFETYRIKSTIFHAVQRQTVELESIGWKRLKAKVAGGENPNDNKLLKTQEQSWVESLTQVLKLFQFVLSEEFHPGWKQMRRLDVDNSTNPTAADLEISCDFCGCDIFQSFFECTSCRLPDGATYLICIRCYVEGRSCACQSMQPMQVRSYQDLLQAQSKAIKVLAAYGNDSQPLNFGTEHRTLFLAACKLQRQRQENHTHTCVIDRTRSWGLNCRACHNSKCYDHLLTNYHLHPSDAILCHSYDEKMHGAYHKLHKEQRDLYPAQIEAIKECQRRGDPPPAELASYVRTHIALTHGLCRPVVFAKSSPGWHDNNVQDCDEHSGEGVPEEPAKPPVKSVPPKPAKARKPPPSPSPSDASRAATSMDVDPVPPAEELNAATPSAAPPRRVEKLKKPAKPRQSTSSRGSLRSTRSSGRLAGKAVTPPKAETVEPALTESVVPSRMSPEIPPIETARADSPPRPPRLLKKRFAGGWGDAKGKAKATESIVPTPSTSQILDGNAVFASELASALVRAHDVTIEEEEYDQLEPSPQPEGPPRKRRGRTSFKATTGPKVTRKGKSPEADGSSEEIDELEPSRSPPPVDHRKKAKDIGSPLSSKPSSFVGLNSKKRKLTSDGGSLYDQDEPRDTSPFNPSVSRPPSPGYPKRKKQNSGESSGINGADTGARAENGFLVKPEPSDGHDMTDDNVAWNLNDPLLMREHISKLVDEAVRRAVPAMHVSASVTPAPEAVGSAAFSFIVNINPPLPPPQQSSSAHSTPSSQPVKEKTHSLPSIPSLPPKPVQSSELSSSGRQKGQQAASTSTQSNGSSSSPTSKKVIYERPASPPAEPVPPGLTAIKKNPIPGLPSRPQGSLALTPSNQPRSRTLVPTRSNPGAATGALNRPSLNQRPSQPPARTWNASTSATSTPLIRYADPPTPVIDLSGHHDDYARTAHPPTVPYAPPYHGHDHRPPGVPHAPDPWSDVVPRYPPPPPWAQRPDPPPPGARMSFTANDVPLPPTHGRPWEHPPPNMHPTPEYNQAHPPPSHYPGPHNYDPWARRDT